MSTATKPVFLEQSLSGAITTTAEREQATQEVAVLFAQRVLKASTLFAKDTTVFWRSHNQTQVHARVLACAFGFPAILHKDLLLTEPHCFAFCCARELGNTRSKQQVVRRFEEDCYIILLSTSEVKELLRVQDASFPNAPAYVLQWQHIMSATKFSKVATSRRMMQWGSNLFTECVTIYTEGAQQFQ